MRRKGGRGGGSVRPLRIGQFLAHYPAPGGTTTAVRGLSLALSELGHQTYVYAYGRPSASDVPAIGLRVFHPAAIRSHDRLTAHLVTNRDRLDIMIINGMFNPLSRMVARACRRGGIACVAAHTEPTAPSSSGTAGSSSGSTSAWSSVPFLPHHGRGRAACALPSPPPRPPPGNGAELRRTLGSHRRCSRAPTSPPRPSPWARPGSSRCSTWGVGTSGT